MTVGVLRIEVRVPTAHSLKEKRAVLNRLKDQLRGRFNVAVAEVDANDTWQRAALGVAAVGHALPPVQGALEQVAAWVRDDHFVNVIRIDQEIL